MNSSEESVVERRGGEHHQIELLGGQPAGQHLEADEGRAAAAQLGAVIYADEHVSFVLPRFRSSI